MNPVNQDTYADIVKSMAGDALVDFQSEGNKAPVESTEVPAVVEQATFTPSQVLAIVEKALGIGAGNALAPADRTGGDALGQEELDKKKKKVDPKKLKKASSDLFKSQMIEMLDKLQILHPDNTRAEIWAAVQDRLSTKFPDLK